MQAPNRVVFALASISVAAYFLFLAGEGVRAYFSPDDLMNLYGYWSRPAWKLLTANLFFFSDFFRPMGGVFYRAIYAIGGFDPLLFRIACYLIALLNLYISYCLAFRLSASRELALLATLIACYHGRFADLYYSTGTVYDLLCFSFYYGAFLYYVRIRQSGASLRTSKIVICCALYIGALNSKEMAVTLPIVLLAYEYFYQRPQFQTVVATTVITALFVLGKTLGPDRMTTNPEYRPSVSLGHYMEAFQNYAGKLFYHEEWFNPARGVALLLLLLAIAWVSKKPHLKLAWCILAFGILPVAFITPRGGFVLYLPMFGWSLFGAALLIGCRNVTSWALKGAFSGLSWTARFEQFALFVIVALTLGNVHRSHHENKWLADSDPKLRSSVDRIRQLHPSLPRGARILFVDDPFAKDETWQLTGLLRLYYGDHALDVQSLKRMDSHPDLSTFDYVFQYTDTSVVQLKPKL